MKVRILVVLSTIQLLVLLSGCTTLGRRQEKLDVLAQITADKQSIRLGEKVTLTLKIKNFSTEVADFSNEVSASGKLSMSFPRCFWGLYFYKDKRTQSSKSIDEFQLPPGETHIISHTFVLDPKHYPFPPGVYFAELRGKPANHRKLRLKVIPTYVEVVE